MQYCGAEREATLREPYWNANYQVQNLRQFVCELEQHSQVRKLNVVTHLRSESQLDQLEWIKGDQQRIAGRVHSNAKPVPAPVTPPVRSQLGRPAPSTLEKLPERGLGQGVAHARVEPEREPTRE